LTTPTPNNVLLETLPDWARELSEKYYSRTLSMFAIHGNVRDIVPLRGAGKTEFVSLHRFLREALFGSRLEAAVSCPECGERLELVFTPADITPPVRPVRQEVGRLSIEGYDLTYRVPNTADLLALGGSGSRPELLDRCVEASRGGEVIRGSHLPEAVSNAVSEAMAHADPQADVRIAMVCPACSHQWSALFDIFSFLWSEIEDWAVETLREVHALASAYGWTEREVLALSPRRRRMYLDMVGC